MRLRINCQTCDARKINEENYREFEQIKIYTEELIVDNRSKEILNRLPFNIKAEEVRTKDFCEAPGSKVLNINGIYEITTDSQVAEGTSLTINGMLKIAPGTQEVLKKYSRISVNGIILCPKSIAAILPFPGLVINGMTKAYPDNYVLVDNQYKLDKYFPLRVPENTGYFAARFIYDGDDETDFAKLAQKNIRFSTDKIYIRKSHIETALPLFNIEAAIVEIPDKCKVVISDQNEIDDQFVNANGGNLYIIGNAHISAANHDVLDRIESLIVEGDIITEDECVQGLNMINAKCDKLIIARGMEISNMTVANLGRNILEEATEGLVVRDCALLKIEKDVPADLIWQRLKIRDCAKVTCTEEQKAAVTAVSRDVALISSSSVKSLFGSLFGRETEEAEIHSEPSAFEDDTKYINADYYEL